MGVPEVIRIFMFSELLLRAGHSSKNISRFFLVIQSIDNGLQSSTSRFALKSLLFDYQIF